MRPVSRSDLAAVPAAGIPVVLAAVNTLVAPVLGVVPGASPAAPVAAAASLAAAPVAAASAAGSVAAATADLGIGSYLATSGLPSHLPFASRSTQRCS